VTVPEELHQLGAEIKQQARELGFDLVGFAPAEPSRYADYLREWLAAGKAGEMRYLGCRFVERIDPRTYLPQARSVICAAINYHVPLEKPALAIGGRIARYALGDDYHELIKSRLHRLADWIRRRAQGAVTRACVDTAPVMEKELAARAGIGWFGKNSCIIHEQIGSWLLLGEIVTTLDLPPDEPAIDRCGTCRRCIDACPTSAITAPYQLDARKCISYLTIEHRSAIDPRLGAQIGDWLFGCDICQEVCPFNGRAPAATDPALQPRFASGTLDVRQVLGWTDQTYQEKLRNSAMKRVKLPLLKRNARIVVDNLKRSPSCESSPD
jgi:epoxyqueuosine reductase